MFFHGSYEGLKFCVFHVLVLLVGLGRLAAKFRCGLLHFAEFLILVAVKFLYFIVSKVDKLCFDGW